MQISNNTTAFNVWKNYNSNIEGLQNSMAKLSSGSRIENAGDDASGLAMSERLRTQSRNTSAAAGNVENKLNYLQTADSWMQKMHDMLGRMGELAVMANDGTKSDIDRTVLQQEFAQMQDEIARITTGANAAGKFNGVALFQGGPGIMQQVGADGGQTFSSAAVDLTTASADDLGNGTTWGELIDSAGSITISAQPDAETAVTELQLGIDFLSGKRADVGAEMNRMEQTLDGLRSYEENIMATESRIRDVDVAKETSEMTKYQILQQVGTAMLAQANQLPGNVMQLFG
ncbi:flagellin [Pontiella agarivorans]|uniref:Flagellin n=1 Tax=Pontiella agarivorans TaxID=3038953 RepID=A0ABU5MSS5_9BACT|nr:flagellin [Pontiella agarivorans]MDZ8117254.1 flagellin [Pontiella agarivorans]